MSSVEDSVRLWRQAKPIFDDLFDFPLNVALNKLQKMNGLSDQCVQKVRKLLLAAHQKNTFIDGAGSAIISKKLNESRNLSGQRIGQYRLLSLISTGGMSSVYLAEREQQDIQKKVAIKVLAPWHMSDKSLDLFEHEQLSLSRLRHPNIVTMHHGGVTKSGIYYMVLDYLENATPIDEYVKSKQLDVLGIVQYAIQIARAMSYAHGHLIIHRDLKASNILIDDNAQLYVVDFGIASHLSRQSDHDIRAFTPEIASPEQILGGEVSVTSDVFSLAATTLSLLLKKPALPEIDLHNYDPENDQKHVQNLLRHSNLPVDLKRVLSKALSINAVDRYQTMASFAEDMQRWSEHKKVSAAPDSLWYGLKLFIKRQPGISVLSLSLVLAVAFFAYTLVEKNQAIVQENQKNVKALQFLNSFIDQTDPMKAQRGEVDIEIAIERVVEHNAELLANDPELGFFVFNKLSEMYWTNGLYAKSLDARLRSIESLQALNTQPNEELMMAQLSLANIYMGIGEFPKVEIPLQAAIDYMDSHLVKDVENILYRYVVEFQWLKSQQLNEQSEQVMQLALQTIAENPQIDKGKIAETFNTYAHYLAQVKQFDEADTYFQKAILTYEQSEYPSQWMPGMLMNYAIFLGRDRQDLDASENYFREAISAMKNLSSDNPRLSYIYSQFAVLLSKQGKLDEAIDVLEYAVPIFRRSENSKMLANASWNLGLFYLHENRFNLSIWHYFNDININVDLRGAQINSDDTVLEHLFGLMVLVEDYAMARELINRYAALIPEEIDWMSNSHQLLDCFEINCEMTSTEIEALPQSQLTIAWLAYRLLQDHEDKVKSKILKAKATSLSLRRSPGMQRLLDLLTSVDKTPLESIRNNCQFDVVLHQERLIHVKQSLLRLCAQASALHNVALSEEFMSHYNAFEVATETLKSHVIERRAELLARMKFDGTIY
ncbi:protein kinase [Marinicella sp. W31]|uniref:protein kinase domain-containing protein n=1 Tax=Marinicella sp. W31 TaxID=3023713 RepID=UPI0037570DA1